MAVAAPVPSTGPSDARGDDSRTQFYALVRTVRADVQDFERSLDHVAEACATAKAAGDDAALRKAQRAEKPLSDRIEQTVGSSLIEIRDGVFSVDHALWSDVADEIRHLDNLWNRVISDWPPTANEAREDVEERLARVQGLVRQMLFHAARLTVADRINAHLKTVRIGKAIRFEDAIGDELPNLEDRALLLAYLGEHPAAVDGVIDTARGLVFRVDGRPWVLGLTWFAPVIAVAAGALVVLIAGNLDNWLNLPDWPAGLSDPRALLTGYFFVTLGAVVHVAVEALKQQRFGAGTSFLALDDALNWLHIRYFSISATVLWVLVGIFGLGATSDEIRWSTAFFVGFSLDSIAGLFLQRFSQAVKRNTDTITKALDAASPPGTT